MRSRKKIKDEIDNSLFIRFPEQQNRLIVELLLDIRELLIFGGDPKRIVRCNKYGDIIEKCWLLIQQYPDGGIDNPPRNIKVFLNKNKAQHFVDESEYYYDVWDGKLIENSGDEKFPSYGQTTAEATIQLYEKPKKKEKK